MAPTPGCCDDARVLDAELPTDEIVPDTKDWTWVLERPCPECGFAAGDLPLDRLGAEVRRDAVGWPALLASPEAPVRPAPSTWSVLEYACHVRDVHRVFGERLRLMLAEDDPLFANWDQDETAVRERYAEQDPARVAEELTAAADAVAAAYDAVPGDAWDRRGRRSNGSHFTVATLGRYHLHDVVHHAYDVRAAATRATVAAYDGAAAAYRAGSTAPDPRMAEAHDRFAARVPAGARVLEIGSGPGHDAAALERRGLSVRRTDVSTAFVDLLRAGGHPADVLDPLTDPLEDPQRPGTPYDAVWASASLLHVARADLPLVLTRLAAATRAGGVLRMSVKEGDGDGWSTHGNVPAPRRFTYWREPALRSVLEGAGWSVLEVGRNDGRRGERWLEVLAAVR